MTFFRPSPYIKVLPIPRILIPDHLLHLPPALKRSPTPRQKLINIGTTLQSKGIEIPQNLRISHFVDKHKQVKIAKATWYRGVGRVWYERRLGSMYPLSWKMKLGGRNVRKRGPAKDFVELIRRDN